jgi:hypothetical protein
MESPPPWYFFIFALSMQHEKAPTHITGYLGIEKRLLRVSRPEASFVWTHPSLLFGIIFAGVVS